MKYFPIAYYLPEEVLDNNELAQIYTDWKPEKILKKTGIRSRHIAKNETVCEMSVKVCNTLFDEYCIDKQTIQYIIVVTQSPDYILPTTACMLQDRLGLSKDIGALDVNLGCSGYVYALSLAKGLVASEVVENVLIVTSETYSKYIHPLDKSTRTLFGDGATATLIDSSNVHNIKKFILGTDGSGYDKLIIPASGSKMPKTEETKQPIKDANGYVRTLENLYMDGISIFNFSIGIIEKLVDDTLEKNKVSIDDIDLFVFHQANAFILENIRSILGVKKEKFFIDVETTGNTVSSSIPIALKRAEEKGALKSGMKVMIAGFGVGLSWGATIINY